MKITPFTFEPFGGDETATSSAIIADGLNGPEEEAAEEIIIPTFSQEELEAAKQHAYDDGFLAGKKEGVRDAEHQNQQHLEVLNGIVGQVNEKIGKLQSDYSQTLSKRQVELGKLVITCAEKLAGEALRKDPISDIAEMLDECLNGLFDSPEITANVHPEIAPLLQGKLPNTVTVNADESLTLNDCTLNWKHGQAMRDTANLWSEVEGIISRHFTTTSTLEAEVSVEATLETQTSAPQPITATPSAEIVTETPPQVHANAPVRTIINSPSATPESEPLTETPPTTNEIKGEDHE